MKDAATAATMFDTAAREPIGKLRGSGNDDAMITTLWRNEDLPELGTGALGGQDDEARARAQGVSTMKFGVWSWTTSVVARSPSSCPSQASTWSERWT